MWLISFVNRNGWVHPNLRLVLLDVYIRSILQYACPVWAPAFLLDNISDEHQVIRPICVQQRRCIRSLLGLSYRLHNILVYIVSGRIPIKVFLVKLCWRYFQRVKSFIGNDVSHGDPYTVLGNTASWAMQQDLTGKMYSVAAGMKLLERFATVEQPYQECAREYVRGIY